mmetsp:Transcript_108682/g.325074  ORF Transcript_108682/g.325074 Transcript_108682/m.325074 type:complete len:271 (+) Transcript_108682:906-1718(+)
MQSFFASCQSRTHSRKDSRSSTLVTSMAWRLSDARTLSSCRSFSLKSLSSASAISASHFIRTFCCAFAFIRTPCHVAKAVWSTASFWLPARLMRQDLAFLDCAEPNSASCVSVAIHCCLARSASSAAWESLTIRSSVRFLQLPCVSMVLATSFAARSTALRRTFREMPISSSTSHIDLKASWLSASKARLACETRLSALWSCFESSSKCSWTDSGMLLKMHSTMASSSASKHFSLAPSGNSTPFISKRSKAARRALRRSQLFATCECIAL